MKNLFLKKSILCLLSINSLVYAQSDDESQGGKLGINTDTPQRTVDVNGGVRLKELGEAVSNAIPLAINKSNNQVVKVDTSQGDPFEIKRYIIPIPANTPGELVKDYDLKIDTQHYIASISSANILKGRNGIIDVNDSAPTMSIQTITSTRLGNSDPEENNITDVTATLINEGKKVSGPTGKLPRGHLNTRYSINIPKDKIDRNFAFYPVPKVYLSKNNNTGTYHFTGFYQDSEDIVYNVNKYWVIEILIINRNWVKEYDPVNIVVSHDGNSGNRATIKQIVQGTLIQ